MNEKDNSTGQVPFLGFTDQQNVVISDINKYVNYVSLVAALVVIVLMLALWLYDKKLVDRVSLRLNVLISVTDLLKSAGLVIFTIAQGTQSGLSCQISPILVVWSMNQYIFLTMCIAFNLQYLFLMGKPFNPYYERWYYILSIGLSFLTGFLPFIGGAYGYDGKFFSSCMKSFLITTSHIQVNLTVYRHIISSCSTILLVHPKLYSYFADLGVFDSPDPEYGGHPLLHCRFHHGCLQNSKGKSHTPPAYST